MLRGFTLRASGFLRICIHSFESLCHPALSRALGRATQKPQCWDLHSKTRQPRASPTFDGKRPQSADGAGCRKLSCSFLWGPLHGGAVEPGAFIPSHEFAHSGLDLHVRDWLTLGRVGRLGWRWPSSAFRSRTSCCKACNRETQVLSSSNWHLPSPVCPP